ncbi:MAG: endonuclease [Polyangiaceae bacterium]|nr:endonuclease [Polyangiaceae bacterium]
MSLRFVPVILASIVACRAAPGGAYWGTVQEGGGGAGATGAGAGGASTGGGGCHEPGPFPDMPYSGAYAGVDALDGDALVTKLCELVTEGYSSMSYTAARQVVLLETDNHGGQVLGVYDGFWHAPTHSEVNIEHTWPQSKGADVVPARSDLHHLFPVEADFNSARSNLPFGEVTLRDWPGTLLGDPACTDAMPGHVNGCFSVKGKDAANVEVFEPRDGQKGDAARAVFYFSVRYGQGCKVKPLGIFDPAHPVETEAVLKKWNRHDPPSDHERQRNDLIEVAEGVRNPFIDHPELVDRISFQ